MNAEMRSLDRLQTCPTSVGRRLVECGNPENCCAFHRLAICSRTTLACGHIGIDSESRRVRKRAARPHGLLGRGVEMRNRRDPAAELGYYKSCKTP